MIAKIYMNSALGSHLYFVLGLMTKGRRSKTDFEFHCTTDDIENQHKRKIRAKGCDFNPERPKDKVEQASKDDVGSGL